MNVLPIKMRLIETCALSILFVAVMSALPVGAFAGTPNSTATNFIDNFEAYTNGTPLISGTNGWYGSSSAIIVQGTTFYSGAQAAQIPADCTLSNRFDTNAPTTNMWIQMDVRAAFYDGTNPPVVDTNAAAMFYINTGGYFVVHNGPATNSTAPTNSDRWVTLTNDVYGNPITQVTNGWVRVLMYYDYANTNWSLYVNHVLLTNNIGFVNPAITNFAGFNLYNGSFETTYLDNVAVMATATNNPPPDLDAVPRQLTNSVMLGATPSPVSQTFDVTNSGPVIPYVVQIANNSWLSCFPTNGTLPANTVTHFQLTYSNIPSSWAAGVSNQVVSITTTNWGGTQSVAAVNVTLEIMNLTATPATLSANVMKGATPAPTSFVVSNTGPEQITYAINFPNTIWASSSSSGGTLASGQAQTIPVTFSNTANFGPGTSNLTVQITSANWGGITTNVNLSLSVMDLTVTPAALSASAVKFSTPAPTSFVVSNTGPASVAYSINFSNTTWVSSSSNGGPWTLAPGGANTIPVTYSNTANLGPGTSNLSVRVTSADWGGIARTVDVSLIVSQAGQTITFNPIADQMTTNRVGLFATSSVPGLVVTFAVTSGPGSISGGTNLTFTNSGTVSITASQAGTADYSAAPDVTRTFNVSKVSASVTLGNLTQVYNGTARSATAVTVPAGLRVDFTYDGNAWAPTNANLTGYAVVGTINDGQYSGVANGTLVVSKADQTIRFPSIPAQSRTNVVTLSATASSPLAVTNFTVLSGPGLNTAGSTTLTFTNVGQVTIQAEQHGDANWNEAAPKVSITFPVYQTYAWSNTIPWFETFENYYTNTPLIEGTNGWYGSSASILVQFLSGSQVAIIPADCTLPNRFTPQPVYTNVWMQMDLKVALYDSTNNPVVNTNVATMFYVNTSGYFVVHNGATTSPTNSPYWVTLTNALGSGAATSVAEGDWVRIHINQNFVDKTWSLFANRVLLTNNIGFINAGIMNFNGFELYSGSSTTYLDNVAVTVTNPPDLATNGNSWLPGLAVGPTAVTNAVFKDRSVTAGGSFDIWRTNGVDLLGFTIATNAPWLSAVPAAGNAVTETHQPVALTYNAAGQVGGSYTGLVTVTGYDATYGFTASNSPQTVAVVMNVMDLQVNPAGVTSTVTMGQPAPNLSFAVLNAGAGSFNYTVTNTAWVAGTSTNGTLGPYDSDTITVVFSSATTNNLVGTNTTTITVASTDGGGATNTVTVTLITTKKNQTINFPAIADQMTTNRVGLSATATSSQLVTFAVTSGPGSISGGTNLTFTNSGTVSITASQGGNADWNPAPDVTRTFSVGKVSASVTLGNLAQVYNGTARSATAVTVPAGLRVDFTYDGNAWAPTNANLTGYAVVGTINDGQYSGVANGTLVVSKADQTIRFPSIPAQSRTNVVTLSATASSPLAVTNFTVLSGPGLNTAGSTTLTFTNVGQVTIQAEQRGDANWNAAVPTVTITFPVYQTYAWSNTIPWFETFENYYTNTPLIEGTNGWYGSSASILVQFLSGSQVAIIPADCTLPNRFTPQPVYTNVWMQMDLKVALYDSTNNPVVNTNVATMFYVNTSGYFVVHNGATTSPTNSPGWVTLTNTLGGGAATSVAEGDWVRIHINQNFVDKKWSLFANRVLLTNNIGFINAGIMNFNGFELYSGSSTTYLDNVAVTVTNPPDLATNGNSWLPGLAVGPTAVTNAVFKDRSVTAGGSFDIWRTNGVDLLGFTIATNVSWLTAAPAAWNAVTETHQAVALTYNASGKAVGSYPGLVTVTGYDAAYGYTASNSPQTVAVVMEVMDLQVNPAGLTNSVMAGQMPTNQSFFTVANAGEGSFNYTATNPDWLSATATNGTLGPHGNATIVVKYAGNTTTLALGSHTGTITVASSDGGGATQFVSVVLNVMGMNVTTPNFSNTVMVGWAPAPQTGQVINLGPVAFGYTLTVTNNWLSCAPTSTTVNAYSTNNFVVTYSNTVGWTPGTTSNTTIIITSTDGGVTNRRVNVALTVTPRVTNFYVSRDGLSIGPYTNWAMAATNIQDAVNAAISGDHVWVSNGVFTLTSQVSVTNGIILDAAYGRTNTFINGNYPATTNRCFYLADSNTIVQGFTISNGCAESGGGVYLTAGATLRDCVVSGNKATETVAVGGGGIFADSFSTVTNCVVAGNTSAGLAGGLMLDNGSTAFNCRISNNAALSEGGGALVRANSAIWNSTIAGNTSAVYGGGVMLGEVAGDTSTVWNCTLENNSADVGGGLVGASGLARNCLIHRNSAGTAGAGVFMAHSSDSTIQNCTIGLNGPAYGVSSHATAGGYFENNIIVSNAIVVATGATIGFTNNCVESTNGLSGSGNITNDPAFIDFAGGNYRLRSGSPCLNTGTNQAWMIGATDLDGNSRITGPSVDMGAYENPVSWILIPGTLTNQVMAGLIPTNQDFAVINQGSNTLYYTVTTNAPWVTSSSNNGTLGAYATNALAVSYGPTTGWRPGTSNALVYVVVTNDVSALYPPQTQTVSVVMNIMQMQLAPTQLTNTVMKGQASTKTFDVANLGNGLLAYTISTNTYDWVSVNPAEGVLTNAFTNTITVSYAATLPYGVTTGLLTVASSSGGGVTQYVALTVNVMDLQVSPLGLTNAVLVGYTPTNQSFTLINQGNAPLNYTLATNAPWVFCADPAGGVLTGPGTNTITVSYAATTGWTPGTSNAIVTIVSTNGGGVTQSVAIVMNVTALLPPSGVTASKGAYSDKVRITWDVVTNATGYQVWRNTANISATATNLGASAATLYDDITTVPEVTYYYWVKSTNSLGVSEFSTSDTGYCILFAPVGLTASKGTFTDKVALSWTATAGAVGYEIWRNTSSDTSTAQKISNPDVTGTSYNDTGATNAVLYTYWVKTKSPSGAASAFSASDTGWRGLQSPSVTASKGSRREVNVTWSASTGATSYELWKNTVDESSSAKLLASGSATSYRDVQVIPGTRYYYWVKALCALGDSGMGASSVGWCGATKWDFNGDGRADVWYYHEDSGRWYVMTATNVMSTAVMGGAGWEAVPADYDGDGMTDLAVYNRGDNSTGSGLGGNWQFRMSGNGYQLETASGFGGAGYTAAVEDYDGDGKADPTIYAQASGTWQFAMSGNGYHVEVASGFGSPGYQAVSADYDGDGKADPALYEEASGTWAMALSGNNYNITNVANFGLSGYVPVPGEYDGRGYAQIAVYHEVSGNWYIRTGSGPGEFTTVFFGNPGQPGYLPIPADYDGDRYDDEAVFYRDRYDAVWHLLKSTEGYQMISAREFRKF